MTASVKRRVNSYRQGEDVGLYQTILEFPLIPWRLRHAMEKWSETHGWRHYPALYRWLRFGQITNTVRQVTFGHKHHFFGYYEKSPWNASGSLILAHEVEFNDRPPGAEDSVTIGVIHLDQGNRFEPLGQSCAWNWQQGAMLQWHPADPDNLLLHNDRRDGQFVSVVRDKTGREVTVFNQPVYAITPDGRYGYSLNFARLQTHRPGYGYAGCADPWADDPHPEADGIYRLDLESGQSELIIPLHQLAHTNPTPEMADVFHWVNHIQVAPDGKHFAFFHIWRVGETGWRVRLYTADATGKSLNCLLSTDFVSHYDWLDNEQILIWAKDADSRGHFWLLRDRGEVRKVIGDGVLTEDGHCNFSPDRRWVLNDTYPDGYGLRTLMLYGWPDGPRVDIARLYSPKERWWGEIRCDLHPRWNREGTQVCIDSVHNGERQMYLVDVSRIVQK
ncbi:hypothetical protein ANAEL_02344 [Anaerolineales bacterium]|nr:hypothetical protein ANAEL_02344 [Anaerolineales bacterium]